jgi:Cu(I)/Ag(I) efflux system membrane fusion protein
MNTVKFFSIVILAGILAVGGWFSLRPQESHADQAQHDIYTCPMHPQVTSDRPGNCPICGMKLVKRQMGNQTQVQGGVADHAAVDLTPGQVQLIGVKTAEVAERPLIKIVRAAGVVAHGMDLYEVQNEYINAYVEFITTYRDYKRFANSRRTWETHRDLQVKLFEAEHKLFMLGIGHHQMELLKNINREQIWNQPELMFFKSDKSYWIFVQLFEDDLGYVDVNQEAGIELSAYREEFEGVVRSVGGAVDPETRTVRVLIEPKQEQAELTIGMLCNVLIKAELGRQLSVPKEAVMDTGTRKLVFVAKADGVFEPRDVQIGAQADDYWAVTKGLAKGERVVVDGNFLIDSESRLKASAQAAQGDQNHVQ